MREPWPAMWLVLAASVVSLVKCSEFSCPEESGLFPDPEQCDKYWVCSGGQATRTLCPDGLAFHPNKAQGEDPCDMIHNVPDKCVIKPKPILT